MQLGFVGLGAMGLPMTRHLLEEAPSADHRGRVVATMAEDPVWTDLLLGDPSKAHRVLGWKHTVTFQELVCDMLNSDLKVVAEESRVRRIDHD